MSSLSVKVKNKIKKKKEEKGILTLDFIFSVMAVYAISMVFSLLAVTLMFASVVQYMFFSIARAHISGHLDVGQQQQVAIEKKDSLLGKYFGKFIKETESGWFKFESTGMATDYGIDWSGSGSDRQKSYGVHVRFTSNLLKKFKFPLLGSPSDGADETFGSANLYSFLYREPTTQECIQFNKTRWKVIRERFPDISSMPNFDGNKEFGAEADNGC